ncbi:hypothetical protein PG1C_05730 [Rugosibacter aromaticivorans]|uniref:Uncharacterized protein n=1 Tax=Rugosibacter aromaticivorans TaxID=1565605 RepID=A0A0C5IZB3_9PROT|nr:hypothetical protein PG1C_05730 [Rugosibacter aromaticivorans]
MRFDENQNLRTLVPALVTKQPTEKGQSIMAFVVLSILQTRGAKPCPPPAQIPQPCRGVKPAKPENPNEEGSESRPDVGKRLLRYT